MNGNRLDMKTYQYVREKEEGRVFIQIALNEPDGPDLSNLVITLPNQSRSRAVV